MLTFWLQFRRTLKVFLSILKDPSARSIMFLTLFTLFSGTLFYSKVEGMATLDALYFSFTTLTTIGYGDFYPVTAIGKIFTMLYAVIGLGVMASFIGVVVSHFIEMNKEKSKENKK
ncbi:potassium channel family protein [Gemelliphila palaticanis]|uniref:Two pore domain potassium channel family protein n=1 Tax=Gemelliphila palaticanis TaxID=81950 RepID=A0ABX2SYM0_9BACL|nr:potassium channel family protein [Gemella palaticanis]MBF0715395.1 two pore domain potassium channel family protein [Gemella palaticanis]NYS47325.1 two pore domain potassium channel family protein [Gemella palaticanis]